MKKMKILLIRAKTGWEGKYGFGMLVTLKQKMMFGFATNIDTKSKR